MTPGEIAFCFFLGGFLSAAVVGFSVVCWSTWGWWNK